MARRLTAKARKTAIVLTLGILGAWLVVGAAFLALFLFAIITQ